jgi:restriction endonuclease S subunit
MKHKLGDIANIHFGPYLKGGDDGDVKYLLASHFDKSFRPTKFEHSFIELDKKTNEELLQPNDIILAGKGQRTFAWAYDKEMGPCVPSSLFFVLHTNPNEVDGKYLAHYLNTEKMQHQLKLIGGGLTVPSIPKKELQKLSIHIPSMDEQMRFVELAELLEEDVALTELLLSRKRAMRKSVLNRIIKTN